jgi:hypothetical protein
MLRLYFGAGASHLGLPLPPPVKITRRQRIHLFPQSIPIERFARPEDHKCWDLALIDADVEGPHEWPKLCFTSCSYPSVIRSAVCWGILISGTSQLATRSSRGDTTAFVWGTPMARCRQACVSLILRLKGERQGYVDVGQRKDRVVGLHDQKCTQ